MITAIAPHTRIDNDIIDADIPKMGTIGFAIFVVLKRHLNQKTGDCYPSYKTIARKVGIDRSTVIRYVKKLTRGIRVTRDTLALHPPTARA
jgi:hypothetical protein